MRAGTANSDSHSLALEQVGYPRNLVFGEPIRRRLPCTHPGRSTAKFDADVRRGHMVGTNGPVLDVTIVDDGMDELSTRTWIRSKVSPAAELVIDVSTAPWIPVTEVRVIVNGEVTTDRRRRVQAVRRVHDFGRHTSGRSSADSPMSGPPVGADADASSWTPNGDAWLVVEAGLKLPDAVDVDGDGLPDLPTPTSREPGTDDGSELRFQAIAPGAWPIAFTNPFLIDVDGDGWKAPGLDTVSTRLADRVWRCWCWSRPRRARAAAPGRLPDARTIRAGGPLAGGIGARRFRRGARGVRRDRCSACACAARC